MTFIKLYLAELPSTDVFGEVLPVERNEEILACSDKKVKREKYFVWKLMEKVLFDFHGITDLALAKRNPSGKWEGLGVHFSLSHSKKLLAVAVSDSVVGVDVQVERPLKNQGVIEKVFSELERGEFDKLDDEFRDVEIIKAWTKKESVFKMLGESNFLKIAKDLDITNARTFDFELNDEKYYLSVSGNGEIETIKVDI